MFLSGVNRMNITKEHKSIVESRINQATNVMIPKLEDFSPEVIFIVQKRQGEYLQDAVAVYRTDAGINFVNTTYERLSEEAWNYSESFLEDDFKLINGINSFLGSETLQTLKLKYLKLLDEWK